MELQKPFTSGLIRLKSRLVIPPMATQSSDWGIPGEELVSASPLEDRERVSLPVILTGGVQTPSQAEVLLKQGAADLIGVGRAMLRNPSWGSEL